MKHASAGRFASSVPRRYSGCSRSLRARVRDEWRNDVGLVRADNQVIVSKGLPVAAPACLRLLDDLNRLSELLLWGSSTAKVDPTRCCWAEAEGDAGFQVSS